MNDSSRTWASRSAASLDPRQLGKPIHLLPLFAAQLKEELSRSLRTDLNRRYRSAFRVANVSIARVEEAAPAGRWSAFASTVGTIHCRLDREILLAVLGYRYGVPAA